MHRLEMIGNREWKEKNHKYLKELEKFLDIADNINDEKLRLDIIYQMLKCDEVLTQIVEQNFQLQYKNQKKEDNIKK